MIIKWNGESLMLDPFIQIDILCINRFLDIPQGLLTLGFCCFLTDNRASKPQTPPICYARKLRKYGSLASWYHKCALRSLNANFSASFQNSNFTMESVIYRLRIISLVK